MTEYFVPLNPNKEPFWVKIELQYDDYLLLESGQKLYWHTNYKYYRGYIDGVEGYIV
jgi:hypothetical protein